MTERERTFTEHIAHLESLRNLKPGERVRVTRSARTGTLVKKGHRTQGWLVRWDEAMFGVTEGYVRVSSLERA